MMTTRKLTSIIIISATVILGVYDYMAYKNHNDSTISVVVWMWSEVNSIVPMLFGFLMGHFFAPPKEEK
jgi:hypothetical protein